MAPQSLVEICLLVAVKNVNLITSLINMPPDAVQRILQSVTSAQQLRRLEEEADEHFFAEVGPHWQRIIVRDFPYLARKYNYVPKHAHQWCRVYERYKKEQDEGDRQATEALKQSFAAKKTQESQSLTKIISVKELSQLTKPPRDGRKRAAAQDMSFSEMKKSGKNNFFRRAKDLAREDSLRRKMPTITGQLSVRPGQLAKAPTSMVLEERIKKQAINTSAPSSVICAPRMASKEVAVECLHREREARLLRLKTGGKASIPKNGTILEFSDEDDEMEDAKRPPGILDDIRDLFGGDEDEDDDDLCERPTLKTKLKLNGSLTEKSDISKKVASLSSDEDDNNGIFGDKALSHFSISQFSPPAFQSGRRQRTRDAPKVDDCNVMRSRRGGLLSNTHGVNARSKVVASPPNSTSVAVKPRPGPASSMPAGPSSPPFSNDLPSSAGAVLSQPISSTAGRLPMRRKSEVDIFMRKPSKKARFT